MDKYKCLPKRQETRDTLTSLSLTGRPALSFPQVYANLTKQGLLISFGLALNLIAYSIGGSLKSVWWSK